MTKLTCCISIILATFYLSSCNSRVQHEDAFYNNLGDYPYLQFPLIKPYNVHRINSESPWRMILHTLWAPPPNDTYIWNVEDVRKLSVKNGVIMAYSPYVDEQANQSIRENYYHWFVIVPDRNIEAGFENEDTFLEYIRKLGIQQPDWREPDGIFNEFAQTGCLDWIPDCK
jgi:hypothetical protein